MDCSLCVERFDVSEFVTPSCCTCTLQQDKHICVRCFTKCFYMCEHKKCYLIHFTCPFCRSCLAAHFTDLHSECSIHAPHTPELLAKYRHSMLKKYISNNGLQVAYHTF